MFIYISPSVCLCIWIWNRGSFSYKSLSGKRPQANFRPGSLQICGLQLQIWPWLFVSKSVWWLFMEAPTCSNTTRFMTASKKEEKEKKAGWPKLLLPGHHQRKLRRQKQIPKNTLTRFFTSGVLGLVGPTEPLLPCRLTEMAECSIVQPAHLLSSVP